MDTVISSYRRSQAHAPGTCRVKAYAEAQDLTQGFFAWLLQNDVVD